jgi:hypothetical protein
VFVAVGVISFDPVFDEIGEVVAPFVLVADAGVSLEVV